MLDTSIKLKKFIILLEIDDYSNVLIIPNDSPKLDEYISCGEYLIISDNNGSLFELEKYIDDDNIEQLLIIHRALLKEGLRWHQLVSKIQKLDSDTGISDDFYILYDINQDKIIYIPTEIQFLEFEDGIGSEYLYIYSCNINGDELGEKHLLDIGKILTLNGMTWGNEFQLVKRELSKINPEKYSMNGTDKFTLYY